MIILDRLKSMKAEPRLACNLECVKDLESKHVQEYCGPVKIVVVQKPEDKYMTKQWSTACYAYANLCIGGMCVATSLHDAVRINVEMRSKAHAVFGLYGLLFFSSFGMLNMNTDYGASFNMKQKQMRREHFLFHLVGMTLSIISWVASLTLKDVGKEKKSHSYHGGICYVALICGATSLLTGIIFSRIIKGAKKNAVHVICGTVAYFWYCVCALSGEHDHWPAFPNERNNHYFAAFAFLLVIACAIIIASSILYILDLWRQISGKLRPVCLDEKQLKKDRKQRKQVRNKERKRREHLRKLGMHSTKRFEGQ